MSQEGILSQISLGKESSLGVAVVPSFSIPVLPSDGVKTEQDSVPVEGINTNPAKNKDFVAGQREYNGAFEMNAYPIALGYIFASALGAVSSALVASETTVYKHTITETVAKLSYTLEQRIGSFIERFAGFVVNGFVLTITAGESVKLSFEGKALSESNDTAITPAYETSKVFDWTDVVSIELGGVDIKSALQELVVEYNNNLKVFHGLTGSVEPSQSYVEGSEVSGSITAYLTDDIEDLKAAFKDKTVDDLVITLQGDETIGNGSNNLLVITLPKISLNTYEHPIDNGYVAVESDFLGAEDPTNGQIKIELTNLASAY